MSDDVIQNMRGRIAKCRRLSAAIMDEKASKALLKMAAEIEHDLLRLEGDAAPNPKHSLKSKRPPDSAPK